MQEKYDVIVVGMGPSSVFCAYELVQLKKYKNKLTNTPTDKSICYRTLFACN